MTIHVAIELAVAAVGVVVYYAGNPKLGELGRILFFVGALAALLHSRV